jgi:hypothetical protein
MHFQDMASGLRNWHSCFVVVTFLFQLPILILIRPFSLFLLCLYLMLGSYLNIDDDSLLHGLLILSLVIFLIRPL